MAKRMDTIQAAPLAIWRPRLAVYSVTGGTAAVASGFAAAITVVPEPVPRQGFCHAGHLGRDLACRRLSSPDFELLISPHTIKIMLAFGDRFERYDFGS